MQTVWTNIQLALTALGGWLGWLFGGFDGLALALVVFVSIDYITGLMVAFIKKKLSSEIGAKGIFKKILIFVLVGIGHIIDSQVLGGGSAIRTAVIFFYLSNEGISILENVAFIGVPIPEKLKAVLEQLRAGGRHDNEPK
ncbi:MAG: phage holin family protein [Desulfitobacteriia bacterium]|jgi:toxin secretion/phage lysis holin